MSESGSLDGVAATKTREGRDVGVVRVRASSAACWTASGSGVSDMLAYGERRRCRTIARGG